LAEAGYVSHAEMTPERLKMATLPLGATPLPNPVGGAPGVLLEHEGTAIVALPGVPEELKGIVEQSLPPLFRDWFGQAYYQERVVVVACGDESVLAPVVDAVARAHPEVYVKSRAKAYGPEVHLRITLSARGQEEGQVLGALAATLDELGARLAAAGIAVLEVS
ncbi:MAG: competence/damage-inducible protein A, partial [Anaerolineae bacterium]